MRPSDISAAAQVILISFESYFAQFDELTARAAVHFASGAWQDAHNDANARLELYGEVLTKCIGEVSPRLGPAIADRSTWVALHDAYAGLVTGARNGEVAETWFNSLTRRVWGTVGVDPEIEFVGPSGRLPDNDIAIVAIDGSEWESVVRESVLAVAPDGSWRSLEADVRHASERISAAVGDVRGTCIEMAPEPFFRGRACYLVGRIVAGDRLVPLIYSVRNSDGRLLLDAIITDEDRVSILFSFTRSYFQVRTRQPGALVAFLRSIMPRKRVAELFISIGFNKHGKTELYRDLLDHLAGTDQQFRLAPGQRGLVMTVFGMPDYDIVFKIIKDSFPPPKRTTRGQIREKYRIVFKHDRAGRLVEAHEFEHLSLTRSRFAPELLAILEQEAARTVQVEAERVIIDHAYLERRVIPLDLFVRERDQAAAAAAIVDYGDAIRDLMASDIFPGDMLLKNFGVTRHGRVVFYDYDELTRMQDCVFRKIPETSDIDAEMSDAPWFSVAEGDVFPEEFPRFMGLPPAVRAVFNEAHSALFDHTTWKDCQDRILAGEVIEIFPYPPSYRL